MRHNGRSPLSVAALAPNLVILAAPGAGQHVVTCPDCGTWRVVRRGMLPAHRAADEVSRCPGSGQRILVDLAYPEWRASLAAASRQAATRRGRRVRRIGRPPVPAPVFRLADVH